MRQYYLQKKHGMHLHSYWNGQNGSPDCLILALLLYSNIYTLPSLPARLLHINVPLSEHSDKKVRLHALDQTVCQLSANINPFDLISCWAINLTCLLTIDPQSLSQRGKLNSQALVLHLARNLARQVASQGAAICEVQMQYRALALFIPFFD